LSFDHDHISPFDCSLRKRRRLVCRHASTVA
jgi:hypothetical protein